MSVANTPIRTVAALFGAMMLVDLAIGNAAADSATELDDLEMKRLTAAADQAIQRGELNLAWRYKVETGNLLATRDERKSLLHAADAYRSALSFVSRESSSGDWAHTQIQLGNVMYKVGTRFKRANEVEEAVTAYRAAIGQYSADHTPNEWVAIQDKLGDALSYTALRGRIENYDEAIAAWRAVLTIKTKDKSRSEWAETQFKIGSTYFVRGEFHEKGTESLQAALPALAAALEVYSRETAPMEWGLAHSLIGGVHHRLGERLNDQKAFEAALVHLEQARDAFNQAGETSMVDHAREEIALIKDKLQ